MSRPLYFCRLAYHWRGRFAEIRAARAYRAYDMFVRCNDARADAAGRRYLKLKRASEKFFQEVKALAERSK